MLRSESLRIAVAMLGALVLGGCSSSGDDIGEVCGLPCIKPQPLYGGEIRLEALILPDLTEVTNVSVFIVDSVDVVDNRFGAYSNLPTPPPDDESTVCTRYEPNNQDRWPLQDLNVEANEQTLDVGATVKVSDGEGTEYVLNRSLNSADTEGRTHDVAYGFSFDGLPPPGKRWTTTIDPPIDVYTEIMKGGTYSPTSIDWVSPPYDANGITVDRSQAMTVMWSQTDPEASAMGTDHFNLLAIYAIPAGPPEDLRFICQTEKDGDMTIPADVMSNFPDQGLFLISNVAHFQPKGSNGKTLHQIGRFSRVQLFTAQN
jgi:hypothetical protein